MRFYDSVLVLVFIRERKMLSTHPRTPVSIPPLLLVHCILVTYLIIIAYFKFIISPRSRSLGSREIFELCEWIGLGVYCKEDDNNAA